MRTTAVIGLSVTVVALAGLAVAPAGRAATSLCSPGKHAQLDAGAAAAVPAVKNDHLTTFGLDRAQQQAAALTGAVNVCGGTPSAATARALAKINALIAHGDKKGAKKLLRSTFEQTKKKRSTQSASRETEPRLVLASSCPDQSPHVNMKNIPGVADNLAIAKKAFDVKDTVTGEAAVAAARSAYGAWVQAGASGSATVGDWLAVKTAAIQLDVVKSQVFAQARAQARALVDLKTAEQADPCTVTKNDFDCWVKMLATVQMVGAEASDELAGARKLGKAIEDRVQNKAPDGCEEWTFQMTLTDRFPSGSVWTVQYPTGSFRVSREAGTVDGTYEAGLVAGGNIGLIGSATDECIETTPDGTTDLGPVTIQSGTFHYTFSGSADATSIELTASSDDASVTINVPDDPVCQFLGDLAQGVLDSIVRSGVPLEFAATAAQDTSTFQYDDGGGATITAQIKRKPLKKP